MKIDGKLYLYRSLHLFLSVSQYLLHEFWQRKDTILQYTSKGDDLAVASFVIAVADDLVFRIVGRADVFQRSVAIGFPHWYLDKVEAIVNAELVRIGRFEVEGKEGRLCVAQSSLHFAHLQHLVGMIWIDTQALSAIDDVFAKTHCQRHRSFFRLLVTDRIVVDTSCHTRDHRIESVAVSLSHNLLQDDSHLLLVNHIACGCHVVLRALVIDTRIYSLDSIGKQLDALVLVGDVRYHIGRIDSGKRLIV